MSQHCPTISIPKSCDTASLRDFLGKKKLALVVNVEEDPFGKDITRDRSGPRKADKNQKT
jgi:hypothetical protein